MTSLIPLNTNKDNWEEFVKLYLGAFPSDERRELRELINIQLIKDYSLFEISNNKRFVGFLELWEFKEFLFLEHIALFPEEQQKGYGTDVLEGILRNTVKPVILEAEPAIDSLSVRRIKFYAKSGFKVLNFDYTQPPYYPGKNSVPMLLLSNNELSENDIVSYVNEIRNIVYKIY